MNHNGWVKTPLSSKEIAIKIEPKEAMQLPGNRVPIVGRDQLYSMSIAHKLAAVIWHSQYCFQVANMKQNLDNEAE